MMNINQERLFKDIDGLCAAFRAEHPNATPAEDEAFIEGANKMFNYFFANFKIVTPNRLQKE